jgi:hypothetical protein
MSFECEIKRYAAYYAGWCVAFGEHKMSYNEEKEINWLVAEDKIGIAVAPRLKRALDRELLGRHQDDPCIRLADSSVAINEQIFELDSSYDRRCLEQLKALFQNGDQVHMYLTNHFCYPPGTRIITFSKKKPLVVMYKEIQSLKLSIA